MGGDGRTLRTHRLDTGHVSALPTIGVTIGMAAITAGTAMMDMAVIMADTITAITDPIATSAAAAIGTRPMRMRVRAALPNRASRAARALHRAICRIVSRRLRRGRSQR